jgi:glycosyltransferase involved in cell wall biosynthesis
MVTVSCIGKFHAFALAEQLEIKGLLDEFDTTYASGKNKLLKNLVQRDDKENIPVDKIHTNSLLAVPVKFWQSKIFIWNNLFDHWVAGRIKKGNSRIFIGWSGMSQHSIRASKKKGMLTILERGSSHILLQDKILREEYKKFGILFSVHRQIIQKELDEYKEADFISVPSFFVRNSFLEQGIAPEKIFMNPYGTSAGFGRSKLTSEKNQNRKFRILYVGGISIRKGLIYLFDALSKMDIPENNYEVWFIGDVESALKPEIQKYNRPNWKWWGRIDHYKLPEYIRQCDVGIQPSLEEGLSMVIPQMMGCGLTVIASTNSGGSNMIQDGVNGFIIPIRDPAALAEKIEFLYQHPESLESMKEKACSAVQEGFTWNDYGDRYASFIKKLLPAPDHKYGSE